jgi:transcriptional regulator with XRE-family HTH domain
MSQTTLLLETLKQEIRRQGKTYADAALALGLSEASVKRLFSEKSFSLERLDILCQWLGMDIAELVQQMEYKQQQVSQMSEEQEQELVSDHQVIDHTAHSLFNRWTFRDVIETYQHIRNRRYSATGTARSYGLDTNAAQQPRQTTDFPTVSLA